MTYQDENNQLMYGFLDRTFFRGWEFHDVENFKSLEFAYSPDCNLACEYCYYYQHGEELYPKSVRSQVSELENTRIMLAWLKENNYWPHFEVFSGEPLIQPARLEAIKDIVDFCMSDPRRMSTITIPTNYTFIAGKEDKVRELLDYTRSNNVRLSLSASFDGKYMEQNRPAKGEMVRDDAYYDRCFQFSKDYSFGFHPMVYSGGIERWKDNFLWFQSNFAEYNLPWQHIYLLEVRNKEWNYNQIQEYGEFIEFLVDWTFDHLKRDRSDMIQFLFKGGYNILRSPLSTIGRGIGCSIQSTLFVRMGDLSIIPCHRTSYPPFITGKFVTDGGHISSIEAKNIDLMNAIYSFTAHSQPYCSRCDISSLCTFGCLGSQFETNGDLFTPIPTVCALYSQKMESLVKALDRVGILDKLLGMVRYDKALTLSKIRRQHGK